MLSGDAMMAIFNAPFYVEDHENKAVRSAIKHSPRYGSQSLNFIGVRQCTVQAVVGL